MQRRQRRAFTPEFKARAVKLPESSGKSLNQICRELDLIPSAVRRWVAQAESDAGRTPELTSDERAELARPRKDNKVLREEREILKKRPQSSSHTSRSEPLPVHRRREGQPPRLRDVPHLWGLAIRVLRPDSVAALDSTPR
jgi:transposase